jgi:soluble cytochrome b562
VLGAGVIKANPFLTGQSTAHVINWAERKMSGKASRIAQAPSISKKEVVRASPDFERYRAGIDEIILAMAQPGLAPSAGAAPAADGTQGAAPPGTVQPATASSLD